MISTKNLHYLEIMEYLVFVAMHVIYSAIKRDQSVTWQVFIYSVGMSILASACFIVVKNEFYSQVFFALCVMFGVHLIGTAMGSLAFGICIFMVAGTLLSIYGERKLNYYYFVIVNMTIFFDLIMEYDIIVSKVPIEFYVLMIIVCEIYLLTESYLVMLYQQKVEEFQIQNQLLNLAQRSKDDFLANMSHEIRTPMNAIVGMSELIMREDTNNPKIEQYCHNIQTSGQNLLAIINDILDFSKLESGKMNVGSEPYSIALAVYEVVNTAMFRRGYKDISITVDISPNIPKLILGDEIRIRQVLINVITNAVKFTEKGCVFIDVKCYDKDGRNWVKISVEDTGIGIKKQDLVHLYESFQRVDTKKNRSIEGTGLGLAICKQLVELMHGTIKIQSEYGKGTVVTIDIPQKIVDSSPSLVLERKDLAVITFVSPKGDGAEQRLHYFYKAEDHMWDDLGVSNIKCSNIDELKIAVDSGKYTHVLIDIEAYRKNKNYLIDTAEKLKVFVLCDPRYTYNINPRIYGINLPFCSVPVILNLNGEKYISDYNGSEKRDITYTFPGANVLVVDDNDLNRKVAEGILHVYKVNCMLASSGKDAINILNNHPVDIVFMDHMMPELDGVETVSIIRQTGNEAYRNVPIIAMTANAVNDVKQMFLKNGFQDFLSKPVSVNDIGVVLKKWLPDSYIKYRENVTSDKDNTADASEDGSAADGIADIPEVVGATGSATGTSEDSSAADSVVNTSEDGSATDSVVNISEDGSVSASVEDIDDVEGSAAADDTDYMIIDSKTALENIGEQRDLYKELLEYCIELEDQRWKDIQDKFDERDWPEYTILVHALKGGMRSLGVEELALAAQGQEYACKEGRYDDVIAGHAPLKVLYDKAHRSIEHFLESFEVS